MKSYRHDYPNQPIGKGNPYWRCSSCGISDPQINGRLSGHSKSCSWRLKQVEDYLQRRASRLENYAYACNRLKDSV